MRHVDPAKRLRKLNAKKKRNRNKGKKKGKTKKRIDAPRVFNLPSYSGGEPKYSFIAAAIRDYHYEDLYNSINRNNPVPFELILVGDKPPQKPTPDNFKYIDTRVKPAQCLEIAVREATGEYLIPTSDDLRYPEDFLKVVEYYMMKLDMDKVFITFRYSFHFKVNDDQLIFDPDPTTPVLGCSGVYRRDLWNSLGGIDNRFVSAMAETDMTLRFFEYGLNIFIPPDTYPDEVHQKKGELTSFARSGLGGLDTLHSFWLNPDGSMSKTRLSTVQSFVDEDILVKNQGGSVSRGKKGIFNWEA